MSILLALCVLLFAREVYTRKKLIATFGKEQLKKEMEYLSL